MKKEPTVTNEVKLGEKELLAQLQEIRQKEFEQTQKEFNEYLKELQKKGFGVDAAVTARRQGNEIHIFLVDIRKQ